MKEKQLCAICNQKFSPIGNMQKYCSAYCREIAQNRKHIDKWVNAKPRASTKWGEGFRLYDIGKGIFKNSQDEQVYKIRKARKDDK